MGDFSKIEWTDATFNPWWGCEKVSPACAHCYAERDSTRYGYDIWGEGHEVRLLSEGNWVKPLKWARLAREGKLPDGTPNEDGHRPRVFTASMADVFEERGDLDPLRDRLFNLIYDTPELDWLVLTKRPEYARDWLFRRTPQPVAPLPNLWMGVSIENSRYTWRADVLRQIPAAVRFISAEPLLGSLFPVTTGNGGGEAALRDARPGHESDPRRRQPLDLTGIDWVIAGGESGPRARPTHPDWFRELRDACLAAGPFRANGDPVGYKDAATAFLFKQWGEWAPGEGDAAGSHLTGDRRVTRRSILLDTSGRVRSTNELSTFTLPADWVRLARYGKKQAGRELDGRTWDEFPVPAAVAA